MKWDLKITLESTYSTHANRKDFDEFTLELKDICWDIPLTAPIMTSSEYVIYLWDSNASLGIGNGGISDIITIDQAMTISWTD